MLAYRHAFHAGNHGDVLKHVVLVQVLQYLNLKPKGWRYVDTHAGAGDYPLGSRQARLKSEHREGISRVWGRTDAPPAVAEYLAVLRELAREPGAPPSAQAKLRRYPGSPRFAQALKRPQDQLALFELHPADQRLLAQTMAGQPGVSVHAGDGFAGLRGQLPPPTRRGLVLIDPSYEGERDYPRVVQVVREALSRFADGCIVVWYPQVGKLGARELPRRLQAVAPKGWLHARLSVAAADGQGFGMVGSGVFVINPPHSLHAALQPALPWLAQALAQIDEPTSLLDHKPV
jgi:23S rRNA (adenine2030-N6)-methyltransferase